MAPKRSRSAVSECSACRKRCRGGARGFSADTFRNLALPVRSSRGGGARNARRGRGRGRGNGATRTRQTHKREVPASPPTAAKTSSRHSTNSDSDDSGPMSLGLPPSDSGSTVASNLTLVDGPNVTDKLKPKEELDDDEPTVIDKLMSIVAGALPALGGELAAHARTVLGRRARPLAGMLRALTRLTTTMPSQKRSTDSDTRVERTVLDKGTMKENKTNPENISQPPEVTYLWKQSLNRFKFPDSDDTLVSTVESDEASTSKCNLTPQTSLDQSPPRNQDPTLQSTRPPTPQINECKTQNTNWDPTAHINRDPRLQNHHDPPTLINCDPSPHTNGDTTQEMICDLIHHISGDITQPVACDLTSHMDGDTAQEIICDLIQHISEDTTQPMTCDLTPHINGDTAQQMSCDPTLLDLTLDDDDMEFDSMLRRIDDITAVHERTLRIDDDDMDNLFPAIAMPDALGRKRSKPSVGAKPARGGRGSGGRARGGVARRRGWPSPRARPASPYDVLVALEDARMKANDILTVASRPPMPTGIFELPKDKEDAEEDDELGFAETYAEYSPAKLHFGCRHPEPAVETASLSSVESADVTYRLSLPDETIRGGLLSALQLEAVVYASQAHEHVLPDGTRAGFLIGDGAGVGKGRMIAGIIFENYLKGRKRALWVSVSNDLKYDAERDLRDIGAGKIEVHPLNKCKYADISSAINGNVKEGVVFSTYPALIGETSSTVTKHKTRLKQLLQWCGEDFDGCIVFDECHRAKNLCPVGSGKPTKTGLTAVELQNKLPKARVVYASATGASEPKNMAYMVRLGIWGEGTPFPTFMDFINAVEKRGVGAMEVVAMDMKLRGMYIARQLSFHGVTFKIEEVPLSLAFRDTYDKAVALWVVAMQRFTEAAELIDADPKMKKIMWAQFWGAHQRFFKYLCIAAKVNHAVLSAREAVKNGKCVVIGLQSTGEARTLDQLERDDGELSDFVSTAKYVFQSLVEKHFPAAGRGRTSRLPGLEAAAPPLVNVSLVTCDNEGRRASDSNLAPSKAGSDSDDGQVAAAKKKSTRTQDNIEAMFQRKNSAVNITMNTGQSVTGTPVGTNGFDPGPPRAAAPPRSAIERACSMKEELLAAIERLGRRLPPNTLDQLVDELGGTENVAEMTGRKGRVVQTEDGQILYESRSEADVPLETLNLTEKQRFMDGEKDVAIISEAASSGISLQSDRRARNQRRRVHITLELPWSADRAIQQFGRTHRSNQVNAPEYIFLISDLAGERRFASTVAKRLESLGALTHGDRRATESRDLSQFNIDNKYGRTALQCVMRAILRFESPLVAPPQDYAGDFFRDVASALVGVGLVNRDRPAGELSLDKDCNNITRFLNRILGVPVDLQNRLFKYFTDTLTAVMEKAKRSGRFDLGILDLGSAGECVRRVKCVRFLRRHATGRAPVELHTVHSERGMDWTEALRKRSELSGAKEGFYLSLQPRNNKHTAVLCVAVQHNNKFQLYRPNTGLQLRQESLAEIEKKYKKVESSDAETSWRAQYSASLRVCSHAYWRAVCRNAHDCEVGLRVRTYHVLSGSVLAVWARMESVLAARSMLNKMQVVRIKTTDGLKIVGTVIPKNCVEPLKEALSYDAVSVSEQSFDQPDALK